MKAEVLVVGAGFAGSEAAYHLARAGVSVILLTQSLDSLFLPVTPIGEPPQPGTLFSEVYEEGLPPFLLHARAKWRLEALAPRLHLMQATATALLVEEDRVVGVETWEGPAVRGRRVVLAVGTFLGARLKVGALEEAAGRLGEAAYDDLFFDLKARGFAFVEERVTAPPFKGAPGYEVRYQRLAPSEFDEARHRLPRLQGLYAAGAVVRGAKGYAAMSADGLALAEALLDQGEDPLVEPA